MNSFPEFMKRSANRIATSSQATPGVEGYRNHELTEEKKAYATVEANTHYLTNHIVPKWGTTYLTDVRTVDVEAWLHLIHYCSGSSAPEENPRTRWFSLAASPDGIQDRSARIII